MRWALFALAAVSISAGCIDRVFSPAFRMEPLRFGQASITDHQERPSYDAAAMRASVDASGRVHAQDASNVTVTVWLVPRACPIGPSGTPTEFADRALVDLGNVTSGRYALRVNATLLPGSAYSVLAQAQPTGLGPAFPTCGTFVALPVGSAELDLHAVGSGLGSARLPGVG